jgi:hypothetical protein
MGQPRVFISHSSREDSVTAQVLDAISADLCADFAVRVDKSHNRIGEDWRHTLNTWIGGCDAAIVLISSRALESSFVAYEASILGFRAESANLRLIPVLLPPVDATAVEHSRLAPANLTRLQAVTAPTVDEIIAKIRKELVSVVRTQTPIDHQVEYLSSLLGPVSPSIAAECARELDVKLDSWEPTSDPTRLLALKMVTVGLQRARPLIRKIRAFLGERDLRNLVDAVASSWVDYCSAEQIRQTAKGERARRSLGTNARDNLIVKCYVFRASGVADGWKLVEIDGVFDENVVETLSHKIRTSLADRLNVPMDDLVTELEDYDCEYGEPLFVALNGEGINPKVVERLRVIFPSITFFFLAGQSHVLHETLKSARVRFLEPPLDPSFEGWFCERYRKDSRFLLTL